jgi:hypothetical protein
MSRVVNVDLFDLLQFEDGALDDDQVVDLFQRLVDSGLAWSLQGSYGRMAAALIDAGLVVSR